MGLQIMNTVPVEIKEVYAVLFGVMIFAVAYLAIVYFRDKKR